MGGGAPTVRGAATYEFAIFSKKRHEILGRRGRAPGAPPKSANGINS